MAEDFFLFALTDKHKQSFNCIKSCAAGNS